MKKYLWMSSAAVVIGALRVNSLFRMTPNIYISLMKLHVNYEIGYPIQKNPKNLYPSYKTDLDL